MTCGRGIESRSTETDDMSSNELANVVPHSHSPWFVIQLPRSIRLDFMIRPLMWTAAVIGDRVCV